MKFRYQVILDHHIRVRDLAIAEVAKADEAIAKVQSHLGEVQSERAIQAETINRTGALSPHDLAARGRYAARLDADVESMVQTIARLNAERERRAELLRAAAVEVKRFETLKQRHADRSAESERKRQAAEADDAAIRHSHRSGPLVDPSTREEKP